jgi:hypothetical protein
MSFSNKINLNIFVTLLLFVLNSNSATVEVSCRVKHSEQTQVVNQNVVSVEFDADNFALYGPGHKALYQWENLKSNGIAIDCDVSPQEGGQAISYCTENLKSISSETWQFVAPHPAKAYYFEKTVGMNAQRTLVGMGRVWSLFEISLNSNSTNSAISLSYHTENTAFPQSQKFYSNYSGVNGIQKLSATQSCNIAHPSTDSGVN